MAGSNVSDSMAGSNISDSMVGSNISDSMDSSNISDSMASSKRHGIPSAGKTKGLTTVWRRPQLWQGLWRSSGVAVQFSAGLLLELNKEFQVRAL
jgi:hypothetical protein